MSNLDLESFSKALKKVPELSRTISKQHFSPDAPLPDDLHKLHFIDCQFSRLELSAAHLKEVRFERCQFDQIVFAGGSMQQCMFLDCQLNQCHAQHLHATQIYCFRCEWKNVLLEQCQLERVDVQQGSWSESEVTACRIALLTLVEVALSHLHFGVITGQDWNLYRCSLEQCHWRESSIQRWVSGSSVFSSCSLQLTPGKGPVWFKCQLEECDISQQSLPLGSFHQSQLSACDLTGSDFNSSIFNEATLTDCLMNGCNMQAIQGTDARFTRCKLSEARLEKALLQRAQFIDCTVDGCCWQHANLRESRISENTAIESLSGARLHDAEIPGTQGDPVTEALMADIERWYAQFQPGPDAALSFPSLPSGVSRYV